MYDLIKRLCDLIFSIFILIFITPILIVSIVLIKLESKGPAFFIQDRIGKNEIIFKIFKLRTMFKDNNQAKVQVFLNNSDVTKIGFYLRRFKIDELPQIINVIFGQMSIVGPRPCLPSLVTSFDENAKFRIKVKPGLTGWSQVNGNIHNSWPERWVLDKYYVENKSFLLDFRILVATIGVIIFGEKR